MGNIINNITKGILHLFHDVFFLIIAYGFLLSLSLSVYMTLASTIDDRSSIYLQFIIFFSFSLYYFLSSSLFKKILNNIIITLNFGEGISKDTFNFFVLVSLILITIGLIFFEQNLSLTIIFASGFLSIVIDYIIKKSYPHLLFYAWCIMFLLTTVIIITGKNSIGAIGWHIVSFILVTVSYFLDVHIKKGTCND